ncbi:MAG: glycosyltransferase family 87 protein [Pirellulaceae bacterium]
MASASTTTNSPAAVSASRLDARPGMRLPLLAAAVIVVACYACSPNFQYVEGPEASPYAGDFLQEWIGGTIVLEGDWGRFYDPAYAQSLEHDPQVTPFEWDRSRYLPIVYPPFYYLLISPLALLPMKAAAWIWAALMIAALAAAFWLLHRAATRGDGVFAECGRTTDDAPSQRRARWAAFAPWGVVAAVAFVPVIETLTSSQKGTVCLLILTATFLLLNRQRPFAAGLVFGLLAFKPQLTIVIAVAMLLKRQGRFVAGGAATGATLVGLCLLLGGDVCRQYFDFASGAADYLRNAGYDLHKSHCLYGFFTLLAGGAGPWAKGMTALAAGGVVLLLVLLLRGELRPGASRFAMQFSALVVATILLSPHLFTYDLTILLLPAFLLLVLIARGGETLRHASLTAWLLLGLYAAAGVSASLAAQHSLQLTVPLLVSLLAVLAWETGAGRYARLDLSPNAASI